MIRLFSIGGEGGWLESNFVFFHSVIGKCAYFEPVVFVRNHSISNISFSMVLSKLNVKLEKLSYSSELTIFNSSNSINIKSDREYRKILISYQCPGFWPYVVGAKLELKIDFVTTDT